VKNIVTEIASLDDGPKTFLLERHAAWASLAVPPAGITFAREEGMLEVEEFRDVILRSGLQRPVNDLPRMATMLANANLLVTARDAGGHLVGVARSVTDFVFCCYLSDLCVDETLQGKGIGRALIVETKRIVGPESMVLLLSAPKPLTYYPKIGMEKVEVGFIIRRDP
jgi:GNAT superfamily N-acetyltransferase